MRKRKSGLEMLNSMAKKRAGGPNPKSGIGMLHRAMKPNFFANGMGRGGMTTASGYGIGVGGKDGGGQNMNGRNMSFQKPLAGNSDQPQYSRKSKKARKHRATKTKSKGHLKSMQDSSNENTNKVEDARKKRKASKPKGAHGRAAVRALGRTKTTDNFKKIEKAKGKGAAIGAYQNALAKHQGRPTPFGSKKKARKSYAHKGHSHKSRKAMKAC